MRMLQTLDAAIHRFLQAHSIQMLRIAIYLLAGQLIGVLAPLVLFTGRLFDGPDHAPTLEGQYVIKDFIVVAAGFVVASTLPGLIPGARAHPSTRRGGQPRTDWTER